MRRTLLAATALALLTSAASAQAVLTGVVLSDSTHEPIANAIVSLPTLSRAVLTNEKGEFRIDRIPAGARQVRVRRLGYVEWSTRLEFSANQTLSQTVYLKHFATLDSVVVNAPGASDESHRSGFGHVVTRADLAQHESQPLADILSHVPGVHIIRGNSGRAWVASSRGYGPSMNPNSDSLSRLTKEDLWEGAKKHMCYAQVYLDDAMVYGGNEGMLFDINTIEPATIESIDYYAGPAQTPMRYMKMNSACGVVVIHTRRLD
jgi:hypothetical protein